MLILSRMNGRKLKLKLSLCKDQSSFSALSFQNHLSKLLVSVKSLTHRRTLHTAGGFF